MTRTPPGRGFRQRSAETDLLGVGCSIGEAGFAGFDDGGAAEVLGDVVALAAGAAGGGEGGGAGVDGGGEGVAAGGGGGRFAAGGGLGAVEAGGQVWWGGVDVRGGGHGGVFGGRGHGLVGVFGGWVGGAFIIVRRGQWGLRVIILCCAHRACPVVCRYRWCFGDVGGVVGVGVCSSKNGGVVGVYCISLAGSQGR